MFTMVATLRETRKHSNWPSLAKIAPHLHKVENLISIALRPYPQCTMQAIRLAPLKMNGKHVGARIMSLQCKRTVIVTTCRFTCWKLGSSVGMGNVEWSLALLGSQDQRHPSCIIQTIHYVATCHSWNRKQGWSPVTVCGLSFTVPLTHKDINFGFNCQML